MGNLFLNHITPEQIIIPTHKPIFRKGELVRNLHYVDSGKVKLTRDSLEGKEIITHIAKEGDFFAEAAIFETTYHCDAIAIETSRIFKYPKQRVIEFFLSNSDSALQFIKFLSHQIRDLRHQLEVVSTLTAKDRIMQFLISRSNRNEFFIPGSIKNLSGQIGLAHETLYRRLRELESEGLIERDAKKIKIIKYDSDHN